MKSFEFHAPVKLISGKGSLDHLAYELQSLGVTRPLIITDKGIVQAKVVDIVISSLLEANNEKSIVFDDVPPNSSFSTIMKILNFYNQNNCDGIIALGGGSVMDSAKAVNILVSYKSEKLYDFAGAGVVNKKLRPFIALPTTSGTGSEVTKVSVIFDEQKNKKIPFSSSFLFPDTAILDPRLTQKLPVHITAATAMDALTHAIEAFIGLSKNPVSDIYAELAVEKVFKNIKLLIRDPEHLGHRQELALASTFAGIAFSNSMVGLVHAIGHSVGAHCHLHHGVCMSLFLPHVLRYQLDKCEEDISQILKFIIGEEAYFLTLKEHRASKCIEQIDSLIKFLNETAKLPISLKDTKKVSEKDFNIIAQNAINDGSMMYTIDEYGTEDVLKILKIAWDYRL